MGHWDSCVTSDLPTVRKGSEGAAGLEGQPCEGSSPWPGGGGRGGPRSPRRWPVDGGTPRSEGEGPVRDPSQQRSPGQVSRGSTASENPSRRLCRRPPAAPSQAPAARRRRGWEPRGPQPTTGTGVIVLLPACPTKAPSRTATQSCSEEKGPAAPPPPAGPPRASWLASLQIPAVNQQLPECQPAAGPAQTLSTK